MTKCTLPRSRKLWEDIMFNVMNNGLGNLSLLTNAETRSISPENFTGEKGKGGMCKWEDGSAKIASGIWEQAGKSIPLWCSSPVRYLSWQTLTAPA